MIEDSIIAASIGNCEFFTGDGSVVGFFLIRSDSGGIDGNGFFLMSSFSNLQVSLKMQNTN